MRRITIVCFSAIFLLAPLFLPPASALMISMSISELGSLASVVCRGTVTSVHSEWNEEGTFIWTYVTLNVIETLKGEDYNGKDITLRVPDGKVGNIVQCSSNQVSFQTGEEAVLFLKEGRSKRGSHFKVVGQWQGKFKVKEKKVRGKALVTFMNEVKMEIAAGE